MSHSERGMLYTYSGKIAYPDGAPSLLDIAVSLAREGRYAGAGMRFWTVALHTFVVCDLLPEHLKLDGLLHDSTECITGDTPKPAKTDAIEAFEDEMLLVIYKSLGVKPPNETEWGVVKVSDKAVLCGEVYTVGTQALQEFYQRFPEIEEMILGYVDKYDYHDMLDGPDARVPMEFMRRFREYKNYLPQQRLL